MGILRAVTAAWGRAVAVLAAAGLAAGCAGTKGGTTGTSLRQAMSAPVETVKQAVGAAPAPPATDLSFIWQQRLGQLPDPSRGGQMTPGLVGQAFLYADSTGGFNPADIQGDLTVQVEDVTPGKPPAQKEVWHFTADVLRKMVVSDERFGRSLAIFLPWPPEWRDVRTVSVRGKYDQPHGTKTVYAEPNTISLDFSGTGPNQPAIVPGVVPTGGSAIPNVAGMVRQMQAGGAQPQAAAVPPPGGWGVNQASYQPPPAFGPPTGFPPATVPQQQATVPPPGWPQQGQMQQMQVPPGWPQQQQVPQVWPPGQQPQLPPGMVPVPPGGGMPPMPETNRIVIPRGG